MIYTASLSVPARKALGNQVNQSTLNKICDQFPLDPESTTMDVVILGPRDLMGPKLAKMRTALQTAHPDICIIYLYENSNEASWLETPYKKECKKIRPTDIKDAFEEFVGQHKIMQGKQQMTSADFKVLPDNVGTGILQDVELAVENKVIPEPEEAPAPTPWIPQERTYEEPTPEPEPEPIPEPVVIEEEQPPLPVEPVQPAPVEQPVMDTAAMQAQNFQHVSPTVSQAPTFEEIAARSMSYEDWELYKEHLNRDSMIRALIQENSEFSGLVNLLESLDKRIETVWRDPALTPDMKFEKIKDIGLQRSTMQATKNSLMVDKAISIINTIIISAKRTVEEKLSTIDVALYKVCEDKIKIMDTTLVDKAIEERAKLQMDLMNIVRGIIDLYKSVNDFVVEEIASLDQKLPSSNAYINEMVAPIGESIFTPQNTATLANKLMVCLQDNTVVASQLEEATRAVINVMFELCAKDEEIIRHQQNKIELLKAQRIEDVVITNTLLKQRMSIFTGGDNTGRSATAITWSGVQSRANNVLLIDLTGRDKFKDYGCEALDLDDFMVSRVEREFVCVRSSKILGPDQIVDLITELSTRLNHYRYVNLIVAPEDISGLRQLSEEALWVNYVTNCSQVSIDCVREIVGQNTVGNIAKRLIMIDTPCPPLTIAEACGVDYTQTKLIPLPNVPAIKACTLRHDRPYEFSEVIRIFEEAFR